MTTTTCIMCDTPLERPANREKVFCADRCRNAFHKSCLKLGQRLYAEGAVTIEQLRREVHE